MERNRDRVADWSKLRLLFEKSGLSQQKLARQLRVSDETLRLWLNNQREPSAHNLISLALMFTNGSVDLLLETLGVNLAAEYRQSDGANGNSAISDYSLVLRVPSTSLGSKLPHGAALEDTLRSMFRWWHEIEDYRQIRSTTRDLAKRLGNQRDRLNARLLVELAYSESMLGDCISSESAARDALKVMPRGELDLSVQIGWLLTESLWTQGRFEEAHGYGEEAIEIGQRVNRGAIDEGLMWAYYNMGRLATSEANYDKALEYLNDGLELARRRKDIYGELCTLVSLGYVQENLGDLNQARKLQTHATKLGIGVNQFWQAMAQLRMAELDRKVGRVQTAIATLTEIRSMYDHIGNANMVSTVDFRLAACHIDLESADTAFSLYRQAAMQFAQDGDEPTRRAALAGAYRARLLTEYQTKQDYRHINHDWEQQHLDHTKNPIWQFHVFELLVRAELNRLTGATDEALRLYHMLRIDAETRDNRLFHAHALLGVAVTLHGVNREYVAYLSSAFEIYSHLGITKGIVQCKWHVDSTRSSELQRPIMFV